MSPLTNTNELICVAINVAMDEFQGACEQFDIFPIAMFPMSLPDNEQKQYAVFRMNGDIGDHRMQRVISGCLHVLIDGQYNKRKLNKLLMEPPNGGFPIPIDLFVSVEAPVRKIDVVYLIEAACAKVNDEAPSNNGSKHVKDFLHDIGLQQSKTNAVLEVMRRPMNPHAEITKSRGSLLYIIDAGHHFVKVHLAVNSSMDQHGDVEQLDHVVTTDRNQMKRQHDDYDRIDSLIAPEAASCQLLKRLHGQRKLRMLDLSSLCQSVCNIKAAKTTLLGWMEAARYSDLQIAIVDRLMTRYRNIGYPHNAIRCNEFCECFEECRERQEIAFHRVLDLLKQRQNTIVTLRSSKKTPKSPETIRSIMTQRFDHDLSSDEQKIYVYKSFVGIGKTQMYLERVEDFIQNGMTVIIAFPSHQLKNDVVGRLQGHLCPDVISEKVLNVPDLPKMNAEFEEEVKGYYRIGDISGARNYIKEYRNENILSKEPDELTADEHRLEQYFQITAILHDPIQAKGKVIITTHERLFSLEHLQPDIVIIDEDITQSLLKLESVEKDELHALRLLEQNLQKGSNRKANYQSVITRLNEIILSLPNKMYSLTKLNDDSVKSAVLQTISQQRKELFKSRIIDLLFNATDFVAHTQWNEDDEDKSRVSFVIRRELPFHCKTFIMSATADKEIYNRLFQKQDMSFVEFDLPILAASITMRHDYSFSRSWFKNKLNELDSFLQYSQLLRDFELNRDQRRLVPRQVPTPPLVVTFKSYEDEFEQRGFDLTMHYGSVTGIDEHGRRSIVVFGTPNVNSAVYALYVNALFPENRMESIPQYTPQLVSNSRYKFYFRTDRDNEKYRKIHMWMVESELVQAIGRARPITNAAPLRIYSNYPPGDLDITFLNNTFPSSNKGSVRNSHK